VTDSSPGLAINQQAPQAHAEDRDVLVAVLPDQGVAAAAVAAVAAPDHDHDDVNGAMSASLTEQQQHILPSSAGVPDQLEGPNSQGGLVEVEQQLQQQDATGQRQQHVSEEQQDHIHTQQHVSEEQQDHINIQQLAAEVAGAATVAAVLQQAQLVTVCDVADTLPRDAVAAADEAVNPVPAALVSADAFMQGLQGQLHVMPLQQQQQQQQQMGNNKEQEQETDDQLLKEPSPSQATSQAIGTGLPEAGSTVQLEHQHLCNAAVQGNHQGSAGGEQTAHTAPAAAEEHGGLQQLAGGINMPPCTTLPCEADSEQLQQHDTQEDQAAPLQGGAVQHTPIATAKQSEHSAGVAAKAPPSAAEPSPHCSEEASAAMLSALPSAMLGEHVCLADVENREGDGITVVSVSAATGAGMSAKDEKPAAAAAASDERFEGNTSQEAGSALVDSGSTVARSLRPTSASAARNTGSVSSPTSQSSRAAQHANPGLSSLAVQLGSPPTNAGVVAKVGGGTNAVVIGMGSAGASMLGAAAGIQVAGTASVKSPLGYDAGLLLSPATRLSLGAASVGDASSDGLLSLSSESDFFSSRRQSLKAAATSGYVGPANLQPLLKVPMAAVPGSGTFASSPIRHSCGRTGVAYGCIEAAAIDRRQGVQQQEASGFGDASAVNVFPNRPISVGSPHRQTQQQAETGAELEQASAGLDHHRPQPDDTPTKQLRQLQHDVQLIDKILNTGLTDFAGSDSEEEGGYNIAGDAKAAASVRPQTMPPDTAYGETRYGGAPRTNLLPESGSTQRAAAESSGLQDDDFDF
jgi:hypothetical protein